MTLFLALALASAPPDSLCGETVATFTVEDRRHLLIYDCSGEKGVWVVVPSGDDVSSMEPVRWIPYSCEDYISVQEDPWPGCKWESVEGREKHLAAKSTAEKLAIAERLLCPKGVIDWTAGGPTCE